MSTVQVEVTTPLLPRNGGNGPSQHSTKNLTVWNFLVMCFGFSLAHGSLVVAINYSSSMLSKSLGDVSNALVYFCSAGGALTISLPIVQKVGARMGLIIGCVTMILYLGAFSLATIKVIDYHETHVKWGLVVFGSIIGGLGTSLIWVAQGHYFAKSAEEYKAIKNISTTEANDWYAGVFAAIYIGTQFVLLLMSSLLIDLTSFSDADVIGMFAILTLLAFGIVVTIEEIDEGEESVFAPDHVWKQFLAVSEFTFTNKIAIGLIPANLAYGFSLAFVTSYINEKTVTDNMSDGDVGYLQCIQSAVLVALSLPVSTVASISKIPVMVFAAAAYISLSVLYLAEDDAYWGHWSRIWAPYVLFGMARVTWENTMKSMIAEYFPGQKNALGFAFIIFVAFLGAGVFYLLILFFGRVPLAIILLVPSIILFPSFMYSHSVAEGEH